MNITISWKIAGFILLGLALIIFLALKYWANPKGAHDTVPIPVGPAMQYRNFRNLERWPPTEGLRPQRPQAPRPQGSMAQQGLRPLRPQGLRPEQQKRQVQQMLDEEADGLQGNGDEDANGLQADPNGAEEDPFFSSLD